MNLIKEFKEFINRGNILDLAIGVVIGAAFGKLVTSFVDNILMPPIGYMLGGINFYDYKYVLKEGSLEKNAQGVEEIVGEVAIRYGAAIQSLIDFIVIAFFIFLIVKTINKYQKEKEEEAAAAIVEPSREEIILTEIRDVLREKN